MDEVCYFNYSVYPHNIKMYKDLKEYFLLEKYEAGDCIVYCVVFTFQ